MLQKMRWFLARLPKINLFLGNFLFTRESHSILKKNQKNLVLSFVKLFLFLQHCVEKDKFLFCLLLFKINPLFLLQ